MVIFLYALGTLWAIVGVLIIMGAWNESATDYETVNGKVAQALELEYDPQVTFSEPDVVMAKIRLEGDQREYRVRGKLYRLNQAGMESIQVGESLRLMVKKTAIVGGFAITDSSKDAPVSGIYRENGETIIPLEKGIEHSQQRLLIGIGFIVMGLVVGVGTYLKS